MACMTTETGLWVAKSWPANRASKTGLVIRCWESMLIASSPLMESLRLSRNPFRNRSNCSRTAESVLRSPRMVLIRAIWDRAMSATSVAHWSQ